MILSQDLVQYNDTTLERLITLALIISFITQSWIVSAFFCKKQLRLKRMQPPSRHTDAVTTVFANLPMPMTKPNDQSRGINKQTNIQQDILTMNHTNTNNESRLLSNFFTLSKQQLESDNMIKLQLSQRYLLTPRYSVISSEFSPDVVECTCPTNRLIYNRAEFCIYLRRNV